MVVEGEGTFVDLDSVTPGVFGGGAWLAEIDGHG